MTKNLFPALSAVLKSNKISLEKEEFKTVLDVINEKEVKHSIKLSPISELVLRVFDQDDLQDNQFYLVHTDKLAIAQNRSQLLKVLLNTSAILPKIEVKTFAEEFAA
jgi:hypothetical protein